MEYSIAWRDDGDNERARLFSREIIIGRMKRDDPYQVTLLVDGELVETGIYDASVSRKHARIYVDEGKLYVVDTGTRGEGSRNGTYVNGERIKPLKPRRLEPGDEVRAGLMTFLRIGEARGGRPLLYASEGEFIVVEKKEAGRIPGETIPIDEQRAAVMLAPGRTHRLPEYDVMVREMGIGGYIGETIRRLMEARRLLTRPNPDIREAAVKLLPLVRSSKYRGILRSLAGDEYERLETLVLHAWRGRLEDTRPLLDAIDAVFELVESAR